MEPDRIRNMDHISQREPEEIPAELVIMDQRLKRLSDLQSFDRCAEELEDEALELVSAAGSSIPYTDFIERFKNNNH